MLPSGSWTFIDPLGGALFNQISVAQKWGVLPHELGICDPDDDLLFMTAYTRIDNMMQGWESYVAKSEAKK